MHRLLLSVVSVIGKASSRPFGMVSTLSELTDEQRVDRPEKTPIPHGL